MESVPEAGAAQRPSVSVVVPFAGDRTAATRVLGRLRGLPRGADDEAIIVDNTAAGVLAGVAAARSEGDAGTGSTRIVAVPELPSSYHARNRGARVARGDWILFLDADCEPPADLVDRYLADPVADHCGALAGLVEPPADATGLLTRYARARGHLDQRMFLERSPRPYAATANMLVRRRAWQELGGFRLVRSGGDVDFCWRLQAAGWSIELRERATVEHRHRDALAPLLRQRVRYAAGHRWLERHHPASPPRVRAVRGIGRVAIAALAAIRRRDWEDACFYGLDALGFAAHLAGRLLPNEPRAFR